MCCVRSKTECVILLWIFPVLLIYTLFDFSNQLMDDKGSYINAIAIIASVGIIAVFSPMAGLLTDLKYSRYKIVSCSSCFLLISLLLMLIVMGVIVVGFVIPRKNVSFNSFTIVCIFFLVGVQFSLAFQEDREKYVDGSYTLDTAN